MPKCGTNLHDGGQGGNEFAGTRAVDGDLSQAREHLRVHGHLSRLGDRQVTRDQFYCDLLIVKDPEVLRWPRLAPVQTGLRSERIGNPLDVGAERSSRSIDLSIS